MDLLHLIQMKSNLAKNFHIQPSEIDKMPMWEFELFIKYLNEAIKEENEQQKQEMGKYHINEHMKSAQSGNIKKMTGSDFKMPSMPSMPKI